MIQVVHEIFTSDLVGVLTVVVSAIGLFVALAHSMFFVRSESRIASKLKFIFFTDAMIYATTLSFGLWAMFALSINTALYLQWVRIPILILNIYASLRLYSHYRQMKH